MVMAVAALVALFGLPGVASAADVTVTTADDHSDQTGCKAVDRDGDDGPGPVGQML